MFFQKLTLVVLAQERPSLLLILLQTIHKHFLWHLYNFFNKHLFLPKSFDCVIYQVQYLIDQNEIHAPKKIQNLLFGVQ